MNLLLSAYLGGVIVGLLEGKKNEKLSMNDIFSLLSWPVYAIIVLVQMFYTNSEAIFSKLNSVWASCMLLLDWVVTKIKRK